MILRDEIAQGPAVVERLVGEGRAAIEAIADAVADRLASRAIDLVVIAGRGTSDHAAIYAQYRFGVDLDLPVALATPSLVSLYAAEPRLDRSLVIGISQSGRSPDIVGVLTSARRQRAATIAITNAPTSELAAAAEHVIDLAAGEERAIGATKTYVAELAAVAVLVAALGDRLGAPAGRAADLAALPAAIAAAQAAEREAEVVAVARHLAASDRVIVIGRGFEYATARELALKLKELARVSADPYSSADFLHGPLVLVEPGLPVIVIAPSGRAAADTDALLGRLEAVGAERIVMSDRDDALARGDLGIRLPSGVPDSLMPIVSIVPGQLLAMHLAIARGIDPEAPRFISKVTLTN